LPRLPGNLFATVKDQTNPYATYTPQDLDAFLRTFTPPADPKPEYSNLGVGLLGYALASKAGTSYEQLITDRVLGPLGMRDTSITLNDSQRTRLAPGHAGGKVVPNWDIPTLAGAGALRSTPADMAKYLAAVLDPPDTRIGRAIRMARDPRADFTGGMRIGLAWITRKSDTGQDLTWHNGGTGGYRSFIGVIPDANVGLVVLTNANSNPDPVAIQALNGLAKR
jgi:CubicO group peptidase (beta-lactamase class C family)